MHISDDAEKIINTLEKNGYEAYAAGGAVRDLIMGRVPHDYDIATNALPSDIKRIFKRTIDTGLKHGTVTVVEKGIGYEVTTFRSDSTYTDGRHPDSVKFVTDIKTDCERRDFTINAMQYSPKRGLFDFFDGRGDIERRVIRCVGDPKKRFKEDALRMLRAVRFSAVLDFTIDDEVKTAIKQCAVLIKKVSSERILEELNKILLSQNPDYISLLHELGLLKYIIPELDVCFGEPQKNKYHIYDVGTHIMETVKLSKPDLILRWAALLHDVGKPCCSSTDSNGIIHFYGHHRESRRITVDVLHRLRMDNDSIRDISLLVENHDVRVEAAYPSVKRMMSRIGAELFEKLMLLQTADNSAKNKKYLPEKLKRINGAEEIYKNVLADRQPYLVSQLAVNGRDVLKQGVGQGHRVGDILKILLEEVIIEPELNSRDYLLRRIRELKKKV